MFSLSDDLSKFENAIFETGLQDHITMDDKLLGTGVTIKDLVSQNKFIIMQLRKMKQNFINYFKLNDKLYKKLLEHEYTFSIEANNLKNINLCIERKVHDSLIEINRINEQVKSHNIKAKDLVEQMITPITEQLSKKIDRQIVQLRIKQTKEQIKEQEVKTTSALIEQHFIQEQQKNNEIKKQNPFNNLNSQTLQIIIDQKINSINKHVEDYVEYKQNQQEINNKNQKNYKLVQQNIYEINQQQLNLQKLINQTKLQLQYQIQQNTNQYVWNNKLTQFTHHHIQPQLSAIKQSFYSLSCSLESIITKNTELQKQILSIKNQIMSFRNYNQKVQKSLDEYRKQFKEIKKKLQSNYQSLIDKLNEKNKQILQKIEILKTKIEQKIEILKQKLQLSSNQIQLKVLKCLKAKISYQLKQIDCRTLNSAQLINSINIRLMNCQNNFENVKDLISTKANFSDLLKIYDIKANRTQIGALEEKIQKKEKEKEKEKERCETLQIKPDQSQMKKSNRKTSINIRKKSYTKTQQRSQYDIFNWKLGEIESQQAKSPRKKKYNNTLKINTISMFND